MGWNLRFQASNNYAEFASGLIGDVGQSTYSFLTTLKLRAYPSVSRGILGSGGTTQRNGLAISPTGALEVWQGDVLRYSTPNFVVDLNQYHSYRINHLFDGEWTFLKDDVLLHTSTFSTPSLIWVGASALNRIGALSSSGTAPEIDLKSLEISGLVNDRTWSADLSGGLGNILRTTAGTNQASLVNFTGATNSWWVPDDPVWTTKPLKYWNGSAWVTKPLKYWNGSAWVTKPLKRLG
jgi:hypothetical protein